MKMTWEQRKQCLRDIVRKNTYSLKPYLIEDGKRHPVAILCPGGGYREVCSFVEGMPFAERLNALGYSAVVVYYRTKKRARFPAPQDDLAHAVRDVFDHAEEWNLDTRCYSVWGASAGGHLTACFGTRSMGYPKYDLPKPGALVLTYPVVTMTDLTHSGSRHNLLGDDPTEEMIRRTSVERHITEDYPPTFVWCGDADKSVNPENSRMLEAAMKEKGVTYLRKEYPGIGHGVGLGNGMVCQSWFDEAVAFWEAQRNAG